MSVSGAGRGARQVSSLCRALLYTVRIVVVGNRPPGARGDPRPAAPPAGCADAARSRCVNITASVHLSNTCGLRMGQWAFDGAWPCDVTL